MHQLRVLEDALEVAANSSKPHSLPSGKKQCAKLLQQTQSIVSHAGLEISSEELFDLTCHENSHSSLSDCIRGLKVDLRKVTPLQTQALLYIELLAVTSLVAYR